MPSCVHFWDIPSPEEVARLRSRLAEADKLLQKMEMVEEETPAGCLICWGRPWKGHKQDCKLDAYLRQWTTEDASA